MGHAGSLAQYLEPNSSSLNVVAPQLWLALHRFWQSKEDPEDISKRNCSAYQPWHMPLAAMEKDVRVMPTALESAAICSTVATVVSRPG